LHEKSLILLVIWPFFVDKCAQKFWRALKNNIFKEFHYDAHLDPQKKNPVFDL